MLAGPLAAAEPATPAPIVPTVENQPQGFPATLVAPKEETALRLDATAKEFRITLGGLTKH